jgi:hypothetical protein
MEELKFTAENQQANQLYFKVNILTVLNILLALELRLECRH